MRAGTRIGARYRVERPLGVGGMALVYEAHDERLDRRVAVKVLADNLAAHDDVRRRFLREARIAARLSHPNVVAVYDTGEHDGRPYIVMELAAGETLAAELRRRGRFPVAEACELAAQAAAGLAHAHLAGVVHRDVKPANLIRSNGLVKIADFGIAHAVEATRLTRTGTVVGTAAYLAPEQVAGGEITPAADVYALGAVLYELLAGRRPHSADTLTELLERKREEPISPLPLLEPAVPPSLDALVLRCLQTEPGRRPTAAEVERALAADPEGATQVLPESVAAPATSTRTRAGRHRARLAVLVVALAVGGTALGIAATHTAPGDKAGRPPARISPVPPGTGPVQRARNLARWIRRYSG